MSHDYTHLDPPPNNAGLSTILSYGTPVPSPKKKTLEFENMAFTYDYETGLLSIESAGNHLSLDAKELAELKAALNHFGIGISAGTVNYR